MKDMFMHHYILNEHGVPIIEPDLEVYCRWLVTANRHVGLDQIGPYKVSTVFLGLDHNYSDKGAAVLWETMIFTRAVNDPLNQHMDRCPCTRRWLN
jgi:hypothetical protein